MVLHIVFAGIEPACPSSLGLCCSCDKIAYENKDTGALVYRKGNLRYWYEGEEISEQEYVELAKTLSHLPQDKADFQANQADLKHSSGE